jgi:hypothetical protein
MDFSEHVALSLPVGAGLALATGQPEVGAAFVIGGVFIDFDHLPDYWREKGFTVSLTKLNGHFGGRDPQRLILALHGWEWCALTWALWAGMGLPLWVAGLAAGWTTHLILDHRYNLLQPWAYWFFARYRNGFEAAPLYLPSDR